MQESRTKTNSEAVSKPDPQLIFKPQLLALLGDIAYSTIWTWMCAGSFPSAIELGPPGGRSTTIAWYRHEIDEWIRSRPRRKLGQHEFRGRGAPKPAARDRLSAMANAIEKSKPVQARTRPSRAAR
jgi:prophage regulatory protein